MSADRAFDPNFGQRMRPPDAVWGGWWQDLARDVPRGFAQTVRRVPEMHDDRRANLRSTKGRPETAPGFKPTPRFWGWRWLCPGCGVTCRHLYLPQPFPLPPCFEAYLREHLGDEGMEAAPASFACERCHKVRARVSWVTPDGWNHVVSVVSGGLLYGNEVTPPKWLKRERRVAFHSRRGTRDAPKRREVEERLVRGWTDREIAADLGIGLTTVRNRVERAKRFYGVRSKGALIEMLKAREGEVRARVG